MLWWCWTKATTTISAHQLFQFVCGREDKRSLVIHQPGVILYTIINIQQRRHCTMADIRKEFSEFVFPLREKRDQRWWWWVDLKGILYILFPSSWEWRRITVLQRFVTHFGFRLFCSVWIARASRMARSSFTSPLPFFLTFYTPTFDRFLFLWLSCVWIIFYFSIEHSTVSNNQRARHFTFLTYKSLYRMLPFVNKTASYCRAWRDWHYATIVIFSCTTII